MSRNTRSRTRDRSPREQQELAWRRIDLHLHTPASADYQEPNLGFLDILRKAELRGADLIAFTDHNSVQGYAALQRDLATYELLASLGRIQPEEQARYAEYQRLLAKIKVLPGFEFTATFGFHILAIFPETTSIRKLEHVLLELNVPEDSLEHGDGQVGATTDVLTAYEVLHDSGALVIPAHVNSTNGVAMQNMPFGGQTKIAFTQSPYIDALEATDLESASRRSTRKFFNGSKPDYPRRMHVMQGSDAHRLNRDPNRETNLGVGDRMTEVQLPEVSFEALKNLFRSENFGRIRPYRPTEDPYDFIRSARSEGESIVQAFHAGAPKRRGRLSPIVRDIVALANGHGGAVFLGLSANAKEPVAGVDDPNAEIAVLREDIARHVTPPVDVSFDVGMTDRKQIVVVSVPDGPDKPYAVAPGNIYVRQEGETTLAVRDEIVELVKGTLGQDTARPVSAVTPAAPTPESEQPAKARRTRRPRKAAVDGEPAAAAANGVEPDALDAEAVAISHDVALPRTGVEIVDSAERDGMLYHSMRDLRNLKVIHNVTRESARHLWQYAILQKEQHPVQQEEVTWQGPRGFWKAYKPRGHAVRYNMVYRCNGDLRVFYGVTEDGLDADWRKLVPEEYQA